MSRPPRLLHASVRVGRGAAASVLRRRLGGGGGRRGVVGGGHEGEDDVEGGRAEEGEAIDVAEVNLAGKEEEEAKKEEEEDGAGEVRVIHEVLVDASEGV